MSPCSAIGRWTLAEGRSCLSPALTTPATAAARALPAPGGAREDWQIFVNLGAALGVPLVAIFAGSEPGRTGPIGHGPIAVVGSKHRQASVPDVLGALETLA